MCGIFAYIGHDHASEKVLNGLLDLQYRGYDSYGLCQITDKVKIIKDIGKVKAIKSLSSKSKIAFGHTRWATHGGVTKANAHPHTDCTGRYIIVHNGMVENLSQLKSKLHDSHQYSSQTDTEVLAHYLEDHDIKELCKDVQGGTSFVVYDAQRNKMYAYKNISPLVIGKNGDEIFVSSDLPTLSKYANHVHVMHDLELVEITGDLSGLDFLPSPKIKLDVSTKHAGSKYHMYDEMVATPKLLKEYITNDYFDFAKIKKYIRASKNIILTGAGGTFQTCYYAEQLFAELGITTTLVVASEWQTYKNLVTKDTLIIALSQSGETIDLIDFINFARLNKVNIITLTNVAYSTLYNLSTLPLTQNIGREVAVASTKAYVFMLLFFAQLYCYLAKKSIESQLKKYSQLLAHLYTQESLKKYKALATSMLDYEHLFVVVTGLNISLGHEAALKFKEIGYLHAEVIRAMEFKHGPLALIDRNAHVLVLEDKASRDLSSTISQIEARGGQVMRISLPDIGILTSLYGANQMHLLAYYFALGKGQSPDFPRNLAKSVTVR